MDLLSPMFCILIFIDCVLRFHLVFGFFFFWEHTLLFTLAGAHGSKGAFCFERVNLCKVQL